MGVSKRENGNGYRRDEGGEAAAAAAAAKAKAKNPISSRRK
jgi:hypothetical protein